MNRFMYFRLASLIARAHPPAKSFKRFIYGGGFSVASSIISLKSNLEAEVFMVDNTRFSCRY